MDQVVGQFIIRDDMSRMNIEFFHWEIERCATNQACDINLNYMVINIHKTNPTVPAHWHHYRKSWGIWLCHYCSADTL